MKEKTSIGSKILFVVLLILSLAWVYPIFMILNNSFKTDQEPFLNCRQQTVLQGLQTLSMGLLPKDLQKHLATAC